MLLTCQVFGARAGRHAAEFAARSTSSPVPKRAEEVCTGLASLLGKPGLCTPREVKRKLQEAMWRGVLVVRTAGSLNRTLEELNSLEAELPNVKLEDGESLIAFFELQNLLLAGRAIIQAALHRKESRGSHYRADYPSLGLDCRPLLLTMDEAGLQIREER